MSTPAPWVALFVALAAAGLASGCLVHLGPDIHPRGYHRGITRSDPDDDCLVCHEPELAAQKRLMAMSEARRKESMDWMMREGGAALVAEWMIDDPRGCQECHTLRGSAG